MKEYSRRELLEFPFRKDSLALVNGLSIQRELQEKDVLERSLISASKRISELEDKVQMLKRINMSLEIVKPIQYPFFDVRA